MALRSPAQLLNLIVWTPPGGWCVSAGRATIGYRGDAAPQARTCCGTHELPIRTKECRHAYVGVRHAVHDANGVRFDRIRLGVSMTRRLDQLDLPEITTEPAAKEAVPATMTPDNVARRWGFAPDKTIRSVSDIVSAAVWRFPQQSVHELGSCPDVHTDVIAVSVAGQHRHTYFADGKQKWSRIHPRFHFNLVAAGEQPRGVFASESSIAYLHIYLPHVMIKRLAADTLTKNADRDIALIDPMCSRDPYVESIARQFMWEMRQPDDCSRLAIDVLSQQLAIRLLRQHSNIAGSAVTTAKTGASYRDWRLRRAIEYLEAHIGDDVTLSEVATAIDLSTTHLANLFRQGTGESPHRWLMRVRIERACDMLQMPHISVTEVAMRCGFASSQHLATAMRRQMATTPTAYRRAVLA
jgi:AraC family transcriptional regulator